MISLSINEHNLFPKDVVLQINESPTPVVLTELTDPEINQNSSLGSIKTRTGINLVRVSIAGILSTGGSVMGGFHRLIIPGSILSGLGNGLSTWLAWVKKREYLIQARIMVDFPDITLKANILDHKLNSIIQHIEPIYSRIIVEKNLTTDLIIHSKFSVKSGCTFWNERNLKNCLRLFAAFAFTGAGGVLSGYVPNIIGIIAGAILQGLGNILSTYLAIEQINDKLIRQSALETMPAVLQTLEQNEANFIQIVNKIINIQPELLVDLVLSFNDLSKEETLLKNSVCLSEREIKNSLYVAIAALLSAAGSLISGYIVSTSGILIGSAAGAAANSISTLLTWIKQNDAAMEKIVLEEFPLMISKVNATSELLKELSEIVDRIESTRQAS